LNLVEAVSDFAFAGTVEGVPDPVSTCFYLPPPPGARFFDPLTFNIERFFRGEPTYPVERTLLTSTILDLALRCVHDKLPKITSDSLAVTYQPPAESGFFQGPFSDA
jgi:hypothetical protein